MSGLELGTLSGQLSIDEGPLKRGLSNAVDYLRKFGRDATAETTKAGKDAGAGLGDGVAKGADKELKGAKGTFVAAGKRVAKDVGDGAEPEAQKAGKRAADGFTDGFKRLVGGLGLGAAAVGAVKFGLDIASQNETAQISFETMLGSADKAKSFLGDLQQFAAKTPFEFPELQTAAGSLVSIGIDANKVIPIMTTLGNVTSGMGTGSEGVKRATVAIQQMNAAGKITAEDLNQLRDAGIPVYDLLASALGKPTSEIAEMASKGKLGKDALDAMMKALENGTGLERFSGLMDKQSASLSGMVSTIKDQVGQGLSTALAPLIPVLKDQLGGAAEWLGKTAFPAMADGLKWAMDAGQGLYDLFVKGDFTGTLGQALNIEEDSPLTRVLFTVRDLAKKSWDELSGFGEWIATTWANLDATSWLDRMLEVLDSVLSWVNENRTWIEPLAAGVVAFKVAWEGYVFVSQGLPALIGLVKGAMAGLNATMAANPIGIVIAVIAGLVAAFIYAYNTSEDFRRIVDGALAWVKGAALAVGAWFAGPFVDFFKNAGKWIGAQFDGIGQWFTKIGDDLMAAGRRVGDFFMIDVPGFFGRAADAVGSAFNGVKDLLLTPIKDAVSWINNTFVGGINTFLGVIGISWRVPAVPGFADGGYTGPGGKYTPAGIVHAGEVVWSQDDVAAHGGPAVVDRMRRSRSDDLPGYAGGGIVANATQGLAGYFAPALAAIKAWAGASGRSWAMTGAGGARTYEQQWALYQNHLAGGNLAADPRKGLGPHMVPAIAMDLSPRPGDNPAARALLPHFGLGLPVPGEPWHVQYLAGRGAGGATTGGGSFDLGIGSLIESLIDKLPSIAAPWGDVTKAVLGKTASGLADKAMGLLGFDAGGYLPPGFTMVANATGKPEPILTSSQWETMSALASNNGRLHPDDVAALTAAMTDALQAVGTGLPIRIVGLIDPIADVIAGELQLGTQGG